LRNPGDAGFGIHICYGKDKTELLSKSFSLGKTTNNMAEWLGLLCASRIVSDNNLNNIV